jgi:hypothetical protein
MLESVRAYRVDLDDKEEELVLYTFRGDVEQVLRKDGFMLLGPRPMTWCGPRAQFSLRQTGARSLFFVLDEAVKDLQGIGNPPRAVGGRTTKPDLTRVRRVTDTMFEYSFDEAVTEVKAEEFTVWTVRGAKYEAASYSRPDARTVRAIFPQLRYIGDKVVMAAVGPEAVKSAESITSQNTIGALRLAPVARANGGTSGPDLTSAEVDVETGLVTYNFDEAIDRRISLDKIDPRNFRIISSAGDQHFGIAVAAIGPN